MLAKFGSVSRLILSVLKEKFKIVLEKNNFLCKKYIFLTIRTKYHLKKLLVN